MAHPLRVSGWLLVGLLLAGCSATPLTKSPTQRLNRVLTMQQDAETAYRSNDMERAVALYLQLTKTIPQEADYWYMLGNSYVRTQQPDRAVDAYQQALARNPNHTRAWHNLGIVRMRQATAAFASSASTAKAEDPMHEISARLASELSRVGSAGTGAGPGGMAAGPVGMTLAPGAAPVPTSLKNAVVVRPVASDPSPVRRRPGTAADGTAQP